MSYQYSMQLFSIMCHACFPGWYVVYVSTYLSVGSVYHVPPNTMCSVVLGEHRWYDKPGGWTCFLFCRGCLTFTAYMFEYLSTHISVLGRYPSLPRYFIYYISILGIYTRWSIYVLDTYICWATSYHIHTCLLYRCVEDRHPRSILPYPYLLLLITRLMFENGRW